MTLQAKLTVGSVLLAGVIVSVISAVDLGNVMQLEFDIDARARGVHEERRGHAGWCERSNRERTVPIPEALRDPELQDSLVNLLTASRAIVEVAVLNRRTKSLPTPIRTASAYGRRRTRLLPTGGPDQLVREAPVACLARHLAVLPALAGAGSIAGSPLVNVRVIVAPALIYEDIQQSAGAQRRNRLILLVGAVVTTVLFSALAFRPLGQIGHMLDLAARGEFDPAAQGAATGRDEFSVMASKVSVLGQRLRGAEFEVSDLRGNIDRLLQDLEDAVFVFNREGQLVFASGAVEKFLGRERAELSGQAIADIFPASSTLGLLVGQTAQTGRPVRNRRVPLPAPAGGVSLVLLSVDRLEGPPGAAGAGAGLLARLRDPEAQRKIGRELQTADRLTAISRITSGVAHEVKNPLNAILLHVEVARAKLTRGDLDIVQQMDIISREIVRLDRVVKTFLDFTRPVDLKLSNVPVSEILEEVAQLARPQAEASNIRVESRNEAEGVEVRADRDLLKQAILNVVVNAMQAMPEGGDLTLEAQAAEDGVELRVSDTGAGIPPELREKIFRLYFTTKKEGSGIGLAMTFRIVQLHDGTIDFTSEPGKGTTFLMRLPIAA